VNLLVEEVVSVVVMEEQVATMVLKARLLGMMVLLVFLMEDSFVFLLVLVVEEAL